MASIARTKCGIFTALVNRDHQSGGAYTAQTAGLSRAYSGPMKRIEATKALWMRIQHRLDALSMTEREAGLQAKSADSLRNIRRAAEEERSYSPRADTLDAIAIALKTTAEWLLHGTGPEALADRDVARAAMRLATENHTPRPRDIPTEAATEAPPGSIREIEIHAGMGGGGVPARQMAQMVGNESYGADAVRDYWVFPDHALRALRIDPDHADIVPGIGDSMEPEIRSGDWCVVDRRHRTPSPDGIYALWDGFSVVFKSLQIVPNSEPPRVRIISKNAAYPMDERALDEVAVIGRVVSLIRRL